MTVVTLLCLWMNWPEWTMDRFLNLVRDGEMESALEMLAPHDGYLDEFALRVAVESQLESHSRTHLDVLKGRCRASAYLAYANDHSITVEPGGVVLGRSFYIYYIPAPPPAWPFKVLDGGSP